MHNSAYVLKFVLAMTTIVALVLSMMNVGLKETHERNEALFVKKSILTAVKDQLGDGVDIKKIQDEEVLDIFKNQITQLVIDGEGKTVEPSVIEGRGYKGGQAEHLDMKKEKKRSDEERIYPVFKYNSPSGEDYYIVNVRGSGLWDEIWGNIAIKDDFKTVVGASFDHTGETPGLGAEIKDNPAFSAQFANKSMYDAAGNYTGIVVRKGGAKNPLYEVDGISGATVTADGVSEMLYRGLKYYQPYFNKLKKS